MEKINAVWLVIEESEPGYDGLSGACTIIAAYDSKEKAMSLAKELADNRASMCNATSQKLQKSSGYKAYGNYYLVEEMSVK